MTSPWAWLCAFVAVVVGQEIVPMDWLTLEQDMCAKNFSTVNTTGFTSYNPGLNTTLGPLPPLELAATVQQGTGELLLSSSLWIDFNGADYFNDSALLFDACAFALVRLSESASYAGQNDSGNCIATLSESCVGDLTAATAKIAQEIVESPEGYSRGNVSTVCNNILEQVNVHLQSSSSSACSTALTNETFLGVSEALTAQSKSTSYLPGTSCTMKDAQQDYWLLIPNFALNDSAVDGSAAVYSQAELDQTYDFLVQQIWSTLFVFMPLVNESQRRDPNDSISTSVAGMACLRADQINPGSRVPPPLQAPPNTTVMDSGGGVSAHPGLSRGAIAGIVVGAIVGSGVILGLAFALSLWRRRCRQRRSSSGTFGEDAMLVSGKSAPPQELPANTRSQELDGVAKSELDGFGYLKTEAAGDRPLVELPGSTPDEKHM